MARIGLVLGAGGVVGQAYHAGVLAALNELTGFDPRDSEVLVGTSAGSVAAASLRAGVTAKDLFARACGRPLSPSGRALLDGMPAPQAQPEVAGRARRAGPSSPELLGRLVAKPLRFRPATAVAALLPEGKRDTTAWFAGFGSPFPAGTWPEGRLWICAVNLGDGKRVVFGQVGAPAASVAEAVQASCAIPAVFRPVVIGGARYVDGGVHSPTNSDLLAGERLDAIVVSSPMSAVRSRPTALSPGAWRSAFRLPAGFVLSRELRGFLESGVPLLVFEPTPEDLDAMGLQPMDFRRRRPVAETSFESARRLLDGPDGQQVGRILSRR
ncbi:MAG: patatin-like phospholipase family protein [Acidimicrobiales bacterium]